MTLFKSENTQPKLNNEEGLGRLQKQEQGTSSVHGIVRPDQMSAFNISDINDHQHVINN